MIPTTHRDYLNSTRLWSDSVLLGHFWAFELPSPLSFAKVQNVKVFIEDCIFFLNPCTRSSGCHSSRVTKAQVECVKAALN